MLIRRQRHTIDMHVPQNIVIDGHPIKFANSVRNLGTMFDHAMNMSTFVSSMCKSLNHQLYKIASIRQFLTTEVTKQLVTSLILSKIDYCNSLLLGLPKHRIQKLQLVQNNASRLITRKRKSEHVTPLLKTLHWLPVEYRITYKIALLCFKCVHKMAPSYLSHLLEFHVPGRVLRSSSDVLRFTQPKVNLKEYGERCFKYNGPKVWNELPLNVRSAPTLSSFKSLLKHHLFLKAY